MVRRKLFNLYTPSIFMLILNVQITNFPLNQYLSNLRNDTERS